MEKITNILLTLIILLGLGFYFIGERPHLNRTIKEKEIIKQKYDSLLQAKQTITVKWDTVVRFRYLDRLVPIKIFDTLYLGDTITAKVYKGSLNDSTLNLSYEALTFGSLQDIKFNYKTFSKTVTKESILYVDKPFEVKVWYPKRHLYVFGSIGSDLKHYSFDAVYLTKKQLGFKLGYLNYERKGYITAGVGIKIF